MVLMTGTPDAYMAVGGFQNAAYVEQDAVDTTEAMIDLALSAGLTTILVAPPPVQSPCQNPDIVTCAQIDARLASLATRFGTLAADKGIVFVGTYDLFLSHPDWGETPGSTDSLFRSNGLYPQLLTGDTLIAAAIGAAIESEIGGVPEPSTGLLLAVGIMLASSRRSRRRRAA